MSDLFFWKFDSSATEMEFDPSLRKATPMMKRVVQGLRPLVEGLNAREYDLNQIHTYLGSLMVR